MQMKLINIKNFLVALYSKQIYHIGTILNQMINYNDFSTIHEYYRLHLLGDPRKCRYGQPCHRS